VIEFVKAYAKGVSASDREFVERVREHILPMDAYTFTTERGTEVTVGGPDLVPVYLETLEAHRAQRGATYIPQLVDHCGESLGVLAKYELDADGIWAVLDLWEEGVQARKGRDFASANWTFFDFGDDGRPRAATVHEVSLTNAPQFQFNQQPLEALDPPDSFRVAASFGSATHQPSPRGNMTPEEMAAALLGSEEFKAAVAAMVAEAIPQPEEAEEVEAMDGESEVIEEVVEAEAVAASLKSVVAALETLNTRLTRQEESAKVAASLRGRVNTPAVGGPKPGVEFINSQINAGLSITDAIAANAALTTGGR